MEDSQLLIKPLLTEKSLNQVAFGWYTFMVNKKARKPQIKRVIEKTFGVKVLTVKTINFKGKRKKTLTRRKEYLQGSWKKAIVKLPVGQKIALFEASGEETGYSRKEKRQR